MTDLEGLHGGAHAPSGDAAPRETLDGAAAGPDGEGAPVDGAAGGTDAEGGALSAYATAVLTDRPVAYWRLGERTGTAARDAVGANAGVYLPPLTLGAQGALTGDPDPALALSGGGVLIGDVFDFPGAAFTIELWVLLPNPVRTTDGGYGEQYLASKMNGPRGYHLYFNAFDELAFDVGTATGSFATMATRFVAGPKFRHVVLTCDGSGSTMLYVDAAPQGPKRLARATDDIAQPFYLGIEGGNLGALRGTLDEVALYDRVLEPARIAVHYAVGIAP